MGKQQSKSASSTGDSNVNIVNILEHHDMLHEEHAIKLWIILAINLLQLAIKLFKWYHNKTQQKAFKKGCKSMENLDQA